MTTATPPPKRPQPPPPSNGAKAATAAPLRDVSITKGQNKAAHKTGIYGTGGIGKTELASLLNDVGLNPLFIDLEDGSGFQDVARATPETWDEMRNILKPRQSHWNDFGAVVIDSMTKAEELAITWTVANVPHEKPEKRITGIESYGFGKGFTHVYETFLNLLSDLDALARRGKQVVCIGHDCVVEVVNPNGPDFWQAQPRLQNKANGNIRAKFMEWCDHLLFLSLDKAVDTEGKATGYGSRTIYTTGMPFHWAKHRAKPALPDQMEYAQGDSQIWKTLFNLEK